MEEIYLINNINNCLNVVNQKLDCCDLYSESSKSLCFQIFDHGVPLSSRCLPARDLIKESRDDMMCQSKESTCLGSLVCAVPVFSTNFTKFIQIKRGNDKVKSLRKIIIV